MLLLADRYEKTLDFRRFWSVDDSQVFTKYSALRSVVVTDCDEKVKMPINEPADGLRQSQIKEYCVYHGGPGVQHVALHTDDILQSVANLKARGVQFLRIPAPYYDDIKARLAKSPVKVWPRRDLDELTSSRTLHLMTGQGGH